MFSIGISCVHFPSPITATFVQIEELLLLCMIVIIFHGYASEVYVCF